MTPSGMSPETAALTTLAEVRPERIDWLWPGYLARGKLHVIDGDPGLGKSTVTLDLVARATTGTAWPDGQPGGPPAGAVLLSAEDGLADTIRRRRPRAGRRAHRRPRPRPRHRGMGNPDAPRCRPTRK